MLDSQFLLQLKLGTSLLTGIERVGMSLERNFHKNSEKPDGTSGCKAAEENISEEQQAAGYEPKFKTFSGVGDQALSAARSGAEFVLEDKAAGKEYRASGESHVPRHSFMEGLKNALSVAETPEQEAEIRAIFSIDYIVRKASGLLESAQSAVSKRFSTLMLPGEVQNKDEASERIKHPAVEIGPPEGSVRNADCDFAGDIGIAIGPLDLHMGLPKTTAPPEIFAVSAHGTPGAILKRVWWHPVVGRSENLSR